MSYCRWSSDNFYSDVYVYEDVTGGWTTHVADNRQEMGCPPDPIDRVRKGELEASSEEFKQASKAWHQWLEDRDFITIEHPEAGKRFNHSTPGECARNLERLRSEGFWVPQYAIDALLEEEIEV